MYNIYYLGNKFTESGINEMINYLIDLPKLQFLFITLFNNENESKIRKNISEINPHINLSLEIIKSKNN